VSGDLSKSFFEVLTRSRRFSSRNDTPLPRAVQALEFLQHVIAELYTWAYERNDTADMLDRIRQFSADLIVTEFDDRCAEQFGRSSAFLRKQGTIVAPLDLLIAATAITHRQMLVTHNTRDFEPIYRQ
jgi:predicted nucleic acid-binding protein